MATIREALQAKGWTEQDIRGVRAAFVGGGYTLSPGRYMEREQWEAMRVRLADLLPAGSRLVDGADSVTMRYDARGIPEMIAPDGRVWLRCGASYNVEGVVRDFMQASVER